MSILMMIGSKCMDSRQCNFSCTYFFITVDVEMESEVNFK